MILKKLGKYEPSIDKRQQSKLCNVGCHDAKIVVELMPAGSNFAESCPGKMLLVNRELFNRDILIVKAMIKVQRYPAVNLPCEIRTQFKWFHPVLGSLPERRCYQENSGNCSRDLSF